MYSHRGGASTRSLPRDFERQLPADQRKRLGQFFTGMQLGRLLASLALTKGTKTVIDPMAGHGDLLDAVFGLAQAKNIQLNALDGVEIERSTAQVCRERISAMIGENVSLNSNIITGDAFDVSNLNALGQCQYDLVITNPPYVRYQSLKNTAFQGNLLRGRLARIAHSVLSEKEKKVFLPLTQGYSGFADLSVPSWILACMMVKSGGRIALVVPATWRNRNYADIIRYMLLRCFVVEFVVDDAQPGWFPDAAVRTNLVIARKLPEEEMSFGVDARQVFSTTKWVQIQPIASNKTSLVGALCGGENPEIQFAESLRGGADNSAFGINISCVSIEDEWRQLEARVKPASWYRHLESQGKGFQNKGCSLGQTNAHHGVPPAIKHLVSEKRLTHDLVRIGELGINAGQGLRTGCNRFFYVTALADYGDTVLVRSSPFFGRRQFRVPADALNPVIRKQADLNAMGNGGCLPGRVLSLRKWVLPEDYKLVSYAKTAYLKAGEALPRCMPKELASFVRVAAEAQVDSGADGKTIPELSAVRTNARAAGNRNAVPRFWYMLPDFAPRHIPAAFVPRINNDIPWSEANLPTSVLVDANFSTFWSDGGVWCPYAIKALLNCSWCRAYMEATGVQLGGGALKLEATHLKQIMVPRLPLEKVRLLGQLGRELVRDNSAVIAEVDHVVFGHLLAGDNSERAVLELAGAVADSANILSLSRRKAA